MQAYSPLCKGSKRMMNRPELTKISKDVNVTAAQVLLRWSLQKGFVPLPKTVDSKRMAENIDVYKFELDEGQMRTLDSLEMNFVTAWDPSEDAPV